MRVINSKHVETSLYKDSMELILVIKLLEDQVMSYCVLLCPWSVQQNRILKSFPITGPRVAYSIKLMWVPLDYS